MPQQFQWKKQHTRYIALNCQVKHYFVNCFHFRLHIIVAFPPSGFPSWNACNMFAKHQLKINTHHHAFFVSYINTCSHWLCFRTLARILRVMHVYVCWDQACVVWRLFSQHCSDLENASHDKRFKRRQPLASLNQWKHVLKGWCGVFISFKVFKAILQRAFFTFTFARQYPKIGTWKKWNSVFFPSNTCIVHKFWHFCGHL